MTDPNILDRKARLRWVRRHLALAVVQFVIVVVVLVQVAYRAHVLAGLQADVAEVQARSFQLDALIDRVRRVCMLDGKPI